MSHKNTFDVHNIVLEIMAPYFTQDIQEKPINSVQKAKRKFRLVIRATNKEESREVYCLFMGDDSNGRAMLPGDYS